MENKARFDCRRASIYMGVSLKTVRHWAQTGKLHGVKVGSRGDWRFSHSDLNAMFLERNSSPYNQIEKILKENAKVIISTAINNYRLEYRPDQTRLRKLQKLRKQSINAICLLAENIEKVKENKTIFENESVTFAEKALADGLTVEETLDFLIVLRKSIIKFLEESKLFFDLGVRDLYLLMRSISTHGDIVTSQIAFVFNNKHKKIQQEYFQSEEKFSKVFDLGPVAYTITNLETGKIINANEMFLKLTRYSTNDIIGKTALSAGIIPDKETSKMIKIRREMLYKTGYISKYYNKLKTKQGDIKTLLCSSVTVKIKGETHILTSYIDHVDRNIKAKLTQENKALIHAHEELAKLAQAKDQFIGIASHQLRTPATAVKQYIGMILEDMVGEISDQQRKYLETAYRSNERQLKLINDFLKTAQIDTLTYGPKKVKQDLQKVLKNAISNAMPMLEAQRQNIVFRGSPEKLFCIFNKSDMDLVFSNLIENASKYSSKDSMIMVTLHKQNNNAVISISDNGVGIDVADQTKIFDKFTRLRNKFTTPDNGNGLGLHWVRKIVKMHGGRIMVTSKLGKGSTFTVWLPL